MFVRIMYGGGLDITGIMSRRLPTCLFASLTLNDAQCRTLLFLFRFIFIPPLFLNFILHSFRNIHAHRNTENYTFTPDPFVSCDAFIRAVPSEVAVRSRHTPSGDSDDPQSFPTRAQTLSFKKGADFLTCHGPAPQQYCVLPHAQPHKQQPLRSFFIFGTSEASGRAAGNPLSSSLLCNLLLADFLPAGYYLALLVVDSPVEHSTRR
jgi:hypothetical protein